MNSWRFVWGVGGCNLGGCIAVTPHPSVYDGHGRGDDVTAFTEPVGINSRHVSRVRCQLICVPRNLNATDFVSFVASDEMARISHFRSPCI